MSVAIRLEGGPNGFAENKDEARAIRLTKILPALAQGENIILDFAAVRYVTQSFIHALIGEPLQKYGESALDRIEFQNCAPQVKSVVELVVSYSLGGFVERR